MSSRIYVKRFTTPFYWNKAESIPFEDYSISESDFRNRTATFTTIRDYNLPEDTFAVKITSDYHETFTGIILKKHAAPLDLYEYECQDWNRLYMSKPNSIFKGKVRTIIKDLMKYVSLNDKTKGLLATNKYDMEKYGATVKFNPMKNKKEFETKDKTVKEIIQQLIYSQGSFIDIHYNDTGIMKFTPYHHDKWLKSVADFSYKNLIEYDWSFNTTDIVTAVEDNGKIYKFHDLLGKGENINYYVYAETSITENNNTAKASNTNEKNDNPYKTKNKEVWVNMDSHWGSSTDNQYLRAVCKELKKLGWKVHNTGVGPSKHSKIQGKNGVWLTLYGGVDAGCLREAAFDTSFKKNLLNRKMRTVIGFIGKAGEKNKSGIAKGYKWYKKLPKAWDDNYSTGDTSIKYPAGMLAYCGVPFFHSTGNNPKQCANLFNGGGQSSRALNNKYKKIGKGYYSNFNWGSKY